MPVDKFGRMSDTKTRDTGVSLTYMNNNHIRYDGSTPVTGSFFKDNGNFVAHTPISMATQSLNDLPEPKKVSDAVTKTYVDDLIADNVGAGYIDGRGSPFFKEKSNYPATHTINMGFKKLLNLSTPSETYEAATKEYEDNKDAGIKMVIDDSVDDVKKMIENVDAVSKILINQKPHLNAINAHYHGPLRMDEYQFAFSGMHG